MPSFTTHMPKDKCGQVHYREGCLCIYCRHFYNCRVHQIPLAKLNVNSIDRNPSVRTIDISKVKELLERSICARKVIESLLKSPKTVRELSIDINYSMRHVYQVVKKLEKMGILVREAELIKDITRTTDGRIIPTFEKIWRYHVNVPVKELLLSILRSEVIGNVEGYHF